MKVRWCDVRERPYHAENTCTRPITDVKQHRARLVVSWETRCEARVSFSFSTFFPWRTRFTSRVTQHSIHGPVVPDLT